MKLSRREKKQGDLHPMKMMVEMYETIDATLTVESPSRVVEIERWKRNETWETNDILLSFISLELLALTSGPS